MLLVSVYVERVFLFIQIDIKDLNNTYFQQNNLFGDRQILSSGRQIFFGGGQIIIGGGHIMIWRKPLKYFLNGTNGLSQSRYMLPRSKLTASSISAWKNNTFNRKEITKKLEKLGRSFVSSFESYELRAVIQMFNEAGLGIFFYLNYNSKPLFVF